MESLENEINSLKLKVVCDNWLKFKKHSMKESSYCTYKHRVEKHIIPNLGDINIYELNEDIINMFIDELTYYLDAKTIKDIICILKGILKYTERKYDLNFKLDLITIPKKEKDEIVVFSKKQTRKLEKYCLSSMDDFRKIGIIFCLNTGVRIGEICALTWNDIDLNNQVINICHTMQRIYKSKKNTQIIITTPKSQKSIRTIPMNRKLYSILKEMKEKNKFKKEDFS